MGLVGQAGGVGGQGNLQGALLRGRVGRRARLGAGLLLGLEEEEPVEDREGKLYQLAFRGNVQETERKRKCI